MKKLMKALAFATVACMLLSTAAFAENSAEMDAGAKSVTVAIDGVTASTPISIVVTPADPEGTAEEDKMTAEDINSGNILYINQDVTDANGDVTFENVDTKGINGVNVFLGYEGVGNSALKLVATALKLEPGDKVEIAFTKLYQADVVGGDYAGIENTDSDYGVGAVVDVALNIDEDRTIEDMFWSFSFNEGQKKYVKANEAVLDAIKVLSGTVRLGVTASAGSKGSDPIVLDEKGVNVIIKTTNADASKVLTIYSDKTGADEKNNTNYVEVPAE